MASVKAHRIIFALCALMLLVLPSIAAAQSSTTIVPFNRTGTPGTTTATTTDPLTGQPITVTVATGAFNNPCTFEFVDVTGSSTISTLQSVDRFGVLKVNVGVVTKGTGLGWTDVAGVQTFSGATYAFNENQQFTFKMPDVGTEFSSDFSDKLSMKGAKSIDNWTVRAHFRIRIDSAGVVKVELINMTGDICKG